MNFNQQQFLESLYSTNQRNILTMSLTHKTVKFDTMINYKFINGFKKVLKTETFEFETKEDAEGFFNMIRKEIG